MAIALGKDLGISAKKSAEICSKIRRKNLQKAKMILQDAIDHKRAIPLTKFNGDVGHKPGMGPGRFMDKTCAAILRILESAEHNATAKGMNKNDLVIVHANAQTASRPYHHGRQGRRKVKRTHIEIALSEKKATEVKKDAKETKPNAKAQAKKKE